MEILDTFIENQGAISGNNATIAENQMKVYEAGLKAGLMQDPDYQEGYEDGRDAAMGVEWESIIDGSVPVGRAKEADYAKKADRATLADRATESGRAANAEEATHARTAGRATEADHASEADHSAEADHASEADRAKEATNAGYSANAGHATTATSAANAEHAAEAAYARNVPLWNVDGNVGAISPTFSTVLSQSLINGLAETPQTVSFSVPMINTGNLYLDFDTFVDNLLTGSGAQYDVTVDWKIYVGDALREEDSYTTRVSYGGGDDTKHFRRLLNVSTGDKLTLSVTASAARLMSNYGGEIKVSINNIRFFANIITAHTYHTLEVEV